MAWNVAEQIWTSISALPKVGSGLQPIPSSSGLFCILKRQRSPPIDILAEIMLLPSWLLNTQFLQEHCLISSAKTGTCICKERPLRTALVSLLADQKILSQTQQFEKPLVLKSSAIVLWLNTRSWYQCL